jgi:DNA modification methylase
MTVEILIGDARTVLAGMPDASVHCAVTSPPYYGLRDYGVDGQLGLETTPDEYVSALVGVFREVRRVLRDDGTLWLNLGDCYASRPNGSIGKEGRLDGNYTAHAEFRRAHALRKPTLPPHLKHKDLIGIPWMVAFALRADGWYLRGDNIWAKPNGMPESTKDRPTKAHEYVFEMSKSEAYYYGYEDVRLPPVPESVGRLARAMRAHMDGPDDPGAGSLVVSGGGYAPPGQPPHKGTRRNDKQRGQSRRHSGFNDRWDAMSAAEQKANGAALRSVWWIAPGGFPGAHFAVMPDEVAATCILAGCPAGGTVLDPFGGAGTTGLVADRLGRNAILIELNPDYAEMARARVSKDSPLFAKVGVA